MMKSTELMGSGNGKRSLDVDGHTLPVRGSRRLQKFIRLGDSVSAATVWPKYQRGRRHRHRKISDEEEEEMEEVSVWTVASSFEQQFIGCDRHMETPFDGRRPALIPIRCSGDPRFNCQPTHHARITGREEGFDVNWIRSPVTPNATGLRSTATRIQSTRLVKTDNQLHLPFQCPTIKTISNGVLSSTHAQLQQQLLESDGTKFQEDGMHSKKSEGGGCCDSNDKAERKSGRGERRKECCDCLKRFVAFLFSTIGLTCLMVGYIILGGLLFRCLEAPNELRIYGEMRRTRRFHVDRLWKITADMNILHPRNWTMMAEKILENYTSVIYHLAKKRGWDGKDDVEEQQWSFAGSLLYSITVVTTIGKSSINRD